MEQKSEGKEVEINIVHYRIVGHESQLQVFVLFSLSIRLQVNGKNTSSF